MPTSDYYHILGVSAGASPSEIKAAYRRLALRYHPDRNRDQERSADNMKRLNEAYAVLSDPSKRSRYDRMRRQFGASAHDRFRRAHSESDIFRDSDIASIFEEMAAAGGVRGFEAVFRQFYGRGVEQFRCRGPGFSARGFVFTQPAGDRNDAPAGSSATGPFGRLARILFRKIGGVGLPEDGAEIRDTITLSAELARCGGPYAYYHARHAKKFIVRIPPAIRNGQKVRLAGQGEAGRFGGKNGDLLLKVRIRKPLFTRLKELFTGGG